MSTPPPRSPDHHGRPRRPWRKQGEDLGPRPVKELLGPAVRRWGTTTQAATLASLFTRWEEIAGPDLAGHVRPVRMSDGVLVVSVEHPAWATKVRTSTQALLGRVGQLTGEVPDRVDVLVRSR